MTKRSFGYIRQLPSGKYQASYVGPDGARHKAPLTFKQRSSAREFLKDQEALIQLNQWDQNSDCGLPDQVAPLFGPYCERHISIQTTPLGDLLELSTQALYRNLLRTHLSPFASFRLDEITEVTVNDWWAKAIKSGKKTALSKCYKLLASVMKRAVTEKYLLENPCRVKGAHSATTGKKVEVPTSEEISELARHMNPRYRVMVLVAASAGLRFGELTALRRCDFVPSIRDGRKALNIVVSRAVGWAYNVGLKSTLWSGACYAIGFGALPILVSYASTTPQFPPWWVVFVAASLGLSAHFANVLPDLLVDRLHGVRGLPQRLGARVVPGALVGLTLASGIALVLGAGTATAAFTTPAALLSLGLATWAAVRSRAPLPGALPFQLAMAAALVMAIGLAVGLE